MALACLGLAIVMYARTTFRLLYNLNVIREKITDLKTITVNDYTVEVRIDPIMYERFKSAKNLGPDDHVIQMFEADLTQSIVD